MVSTPARFAVALAIVLALWPWVALAADAKGLVDGNKLWDGARIGLMTRFCGGSALDMSNRLPTRWWPSGPDVNALAAPWHSGNWKTLSENISKNTRKTATTAQMLLSLLRLRKPSLARASS